MPTVLKIARQINHASCLRPAAYHMAISVMTQSNRASMTTKTMAQVGKTLKISESVVSMVIKFKGERLNLFQAALSKQR